MKKTENLLEAINDLDDTIILDALSKPVTYSNKRKILRVFGAAALLALMGLTACGVHSLSVWYQNYFAQQSQTELSEEQKTYLNENVIEVAPQQPGLTIESALTDGIRIFMKLRVTAPEDVVLYPDNNGHVRGYPGNGDPTLAYSLGDVVTLDGRRIYDSYSLQCIPVEDGDGLDYTMDYIFLCLLEEPWDPEIGTMGPLNLAGRTIKVRIRDFYQSISNEDFTKTEEQRILFGEWDFDIPVTEEHLKTREMISEPTVASLRYADMDAGAIVWKENVSIPYITIRALSIDIGYDCPGIGGDFGWEIRAVMKDGREIMLKPQWGGVDFVGYLADAPMVIDQVDHLIFEDGTVIPAS